MALQMDDLALFVDVVGLEHIKILFSRLGVGHHPGLKEIGGRFAFGQKRLDPIDDALALIGEEIGVKLGDGAFLYLPNRARFEAQYLIRAQIKKEDGDRVLRFVHRLGVAFVAVAGDEKSRSQADDPANHDDGDGQGGPIGSEDFDGFLPHSLGRIAQRRGFIILQEDENMGKMSKRDGNNANLARLLRIYRPICKEILLKK